MRRVLRRGGEGRSQVEVDKRRGRKKREQFKRKKKKRNGMIFAEGGKPEPGEIPLKHMRKPNSNSNLTDNTEPDRT